jgi:DNA-binding IclR family transcriptional regulator
VARPRVRPEQREKPANASDGAFLVRALSKGLTVIGLFDAENREWTLDEIAERAGLPRMTAYRMIRTMEAAGYLVRDPVTSRYHLGPALLATTYISETYLELVTIARPYLHELASETGESATLAVEVDGVAVSVDTVDTSRPFRREVALGRIIGDTANAHGKIFAAFKSEAERVEIAALAHPQMTPHDHRSGGACRRVGTRAPGGNGLRHRGAEHRYLCRGCSGARPTGQSDRLHIARDPDRALRPG